MTRPSPPPSAPWRSPRRVGRSSCSPGEPLPRLAYHAQGDYHRAIDCLGQTVAALEGVRRHERFGQVHPARCALPCLPCCVPCRVGHVRRGQGLRGGRAADCRGGCAPREPHVCLVGGGLLSLRQGDLRRALPLLERAMGICYDTDLPVYFPLMAAAFGRVHAGRARRRCCAAAHAGARTDHGQGHGRLAGAL